MPLLTPPTATARRLRSRPRLVVGLALLLTAGAVPTLTSSSSAAPPFPVHVDAGGTGVRTTSGSVYRADTGATGGRLYRAAASQGIAGTSDDGLYRTVRYGMGAYRFGVPANGTYRVDLHLVELQVGGRGKRVFDVSAEGRTVLRAVDVHRSHGRYRAAVLSFEVRIGDRRLDLAFRNRTSLPAAVAAVTVRSAGSSTAAPRPAAPRPAASSTPTPASSPPASPATSSSTGLPTRDSTGPRVPLASLTPSSGITTSHDGQIIERKDVTGNIKVLHDRVVVRDSRISFTRTYGLQVAKKADGTCPVGARFEHVELDGRLADEADVPVYGNGCGWTLDHADVHGVGRAIKLVNDNVVTNSHIVSSRTGDSGSHRGAVGVNGGRNNRVVNNVLLCEGTGCSAAIPMYGDFSPVQGMLVERNLLATTGSYCAYGGSLDGKRYPDGSGIRFIDNRFSTRYSSKCGKYGTVSGFEGGVRGNEARGNVWHETGRPVAIG